MKSPPHVILLVCCTAILNFGNGIAQARNVPVTINAFSSTEVEFMRSGAFRIVNRNAGIQESDPEFQMVSNEIKEALTDKGYVEATGNIEPDLAITVIYVVGPPKIEFETEMSPLYSGLGESGAGGVPAFHRGSAEVSRRREFSQRPTVLQKPKGCAHPEQKYRARCQAGRYPGGNGLR